MVFAEMNICGRLLNYMRQRVIRVIKLRLTPRLKAKTLSTMTLDGQTLDIMRCMIISSMMVVRKRQKEKFLHAADKTVKEIQDSGFGVWVSGTMTFAWGSNMTIANKGMLLLMAK